MFLFSAILRSLCSALLVIAPCLADAAAPRGAMRRDVIISPLLDGAHDEETLALSRALHAAIAALPHYHVIDQGIMHDLLSYHEYRDQTSSDQINQLRQKLERARERYFQLAYQEASALLDQLIREGSTFSLSHPLGELLWEARITRGIVAKAAGDDAKARTDFSAALRLHPLAVLDEHAFAPSIVEFFAAERRRMLLEPHGAIAVQSDPAVAEVYLNGNYQGVTPLLLQGLPQGEYVVELKTNRYRSAGETVVVQPGETSKVAHKLVFERRQKKTEQPLILHGDPRAEVDFGLHLADVARADRVVLVKASIVENGRAVFQGRVIDRRFRTGFRPTSVHVDAAQPEKSQLRFFDDIREALAENLLTERTPLDPPGKGSVGLLGARLRRSTSEEKFVWGSFGLPTLGAVVGGIAAALSSGEGAAAGSARISFR